MKDPNIDAFHDVLALIYADDIVFLSDSLVKVREVVSILEKYVKMKGLTVNVKKSQLLICKRGRPSKLEQPLKFENENIDVVKNYSYLGITIANSSVGLAAAKEAIQKARVASGAALSILARARSDSFESNKRIFQSICTSTLVYGAPAWALRYLELLEPVQLSYYKRIYRLPVCTPAYAVRLEFNLSPVEVVIFSLTLKWIVKILNMAPDRLPRICFLREVHLF